MRSYARTSVVCVCVSPSVICTVKRSWMPNWPRYGILIGPDFRLDNNFPKNELNKILHVRLIDHLCIPFSCSSSFCIIFIFAGFLFFCLGFSSGSFLVHLFVFFCSLGSSNTYNSFFSVHSLAYTHNIDIYIYIQMFPTKWNVTNKMNNGATLCRKCVSIDSAGAADPRQKLNNFLSRMSLSFSQNDCLCFQYCGLCC